MKGAFYVIRGAVLGLSLAMLAACSGSNGSSTGSSSGPTFNGAPLANAQRTTQRRQHGNSAQLAGWRSMSQDPQSFLPLTAGERGVPQFTLTGTGAPIAKEVFSPALRVKPGRTYTFSGWIDTSKVVDGNTILWVSSADLLHMYAAASVPPRQTGRFSFNFAIPSDVSQVHFGYYSNGCVIPKGQKITFSQPMVNEQ